MTTENLAKWKDTYEQSLELTDTLFTLLDLLIDYCKSHDISLYQEQGIWNLVNKAQLILNQIEYANSVPMPKLGRRKVTGFDQKDRTDGEVTEPCIESILGSKYVRLPLLSFLRNQNARNGS